MKFNDKIIKDRATTITIKNKKKKKKKRKENDENDENNNVMITIENIFETTFF